MIFNYTWNYDNYGGKYTDKLCPFREGKTHIASMNCQECKHHMELINFDKGGYVVCNMNKGINNEP